MFGPVEKHKTKEAILKTSFPKVISRNAMFYKETTTRTATSSNQQLQKAKLCPFVTLKNYPIII